jgi:hypothetical protein
MPAIQVGETLEVPDDERDEEDVHRTEAEHRDGRCQQRADQDARAADDRQPLGHGSDDVRGGARRRTRHLGDPSRIARHAQHEGERDQEGGRVEPETDEPRSEGGEDEPRQSGADDAADDHRCLRQGVRRRKALGRHDVRQQRGPRRAEEGGDAGLREAEDVHQRQERRALHEREGEHDAGPQQVGREHDPTPIPPVHVDAGDQADREGRDRLSDRHHRQRGGRAGQVVDDQQDQEQGDPVADVGHRLPDEEGSEVADAQHVADAQRLRLRLDGHRPFRPFGPSRSS